MTVKFESFIVCKLDLLLILQSSVKHPDGRRCFRYFEWREAGRTLCSILFFGNLNTSSPEYIDPQWSSNLVGEDTKEGSTTWGFTRRFGVVRDLGDGRRDGMVR